VSGRRLYVNRCHGKIRNANEEVEMVGTYLVNPQQFKPSS